MNWYWVLINLGINKDAWSWRGYKEGQITVSSERIKEVYKGTYEQIWNLAWLRDADFKLFPKEEKEKGTRQILEKMVKVK